MTSRRITMSIKQELHIFLGFFLRRACDNSSLLGSIPSLRGKTAYCRGSIIEAEKLLAFDSLKRILRKAEVAV